MGLLGKVFREEVELIYKGKKLLKKGKYDEALKCFDKALETEPTNFHAYENKANVFNEIGLKNLEMEKYDYALKSFNEALKNQNKSLEIEGSDTILEDKAAVLTNMAFTLSEQSKYDKAIEYYDDALALDPKNKDAKILKLATIKLKQEKMQENSSKQPEISKISFICPKCETENINEAKFCLECGTILKTKEN